jgi:hypothetical protein
MCRSQLRSAAMPQVRKLPPDFPFKTSWTAFVVVDGAGGVDLGARATLNHARADSRR